MWADNRYQRSSSAQLLAAGEKPGDASAPEGVVNLLAQESHSTGIVMDAVKMHPAAGRHASHRIKQRKQQIVLLPAAQAASPLAPLGADMGLDDCFAYFNPTSAQDLADTTATWSEALIAAAEYLDSSS